MLKKTDETYFDGETEVEKRSVAIIGAGFGGLSAAMLLSEKGYNVHVFDRLHTVGGRGSSKTQEGHRFDLGPTILTLPKNFEELWKRCGDDLSQHVKIEKLNPYYDLIFEDNDVLSVSGNKSNFEAQIKKFAPNDLKGYRKFMRLSERQYNFAFSKKGSMGRSPMHRLWDTLKVLPIFALLRADRSVYRSAASYVSNSKLRFALSFHPLFVGGNPFTVTSMWGLVNYLEHKFGVYYIHGGAQAMANKMAEKIKSLGGQVTLNTTVNKILTKENRVIGIQLESGEKISADYIVSNADLQNTYDGLLGHKKKKRWTKRKLDMKNWSMSLFVWHFGTSKTRSKWKNVGHHTILVGPNYKKEVNDIFIKGELPQEMSLYVHRPSVTDKTCAPKGDDTFYVLACVPNLSFKNDIHWRNIEKSYKKKLLDVLERRLLPGLGQKIKTEYVMTPLDFKERYLSHFGSGFSLEPQMFQSAWFRPHNRSEEFDNLFLVGAGTHPGPGLPGVLASAEILDEILPNLKKVANKTSYSTIKKVMQV